MPFGPASLTDAFGCRIAAAQTPVKREGEAAIPECAAFLRAAHHIGAAPEHRAPGEAATAFEMLHVALYEDDWAVLYNPEGVLRAWVHSEAHRLQVAKSSDRPYGPWPSSTSGPCRSRQMPCSHWRV